MLNSIQARPSVLIIEDEATQRHLLQKQLEQQEFRVITAENGRIGIETWLADKDIRIVITDLDMPDADGFEVISAIRKRNERYTYIMVLTVAADKASLLKGLAIGADDFVNKPIIKEELALRLKSALRLLRLEDHHLLLEGMAELAAARSGESPAHLQRTKTYCAILADDLRRHNPELGLTEQVVTDLAHISVLHDIGKVGIPDSLLFKRGSLSPKERDIIKDHTTIGGMILKDLYVKTGSSFLMMGHDITIAHHEKWDGTGYPKGLKGDEIPLVGRIMALADVYDALLSRRPYKDPYTPKHAESIVITENGSQFDPRIIASFLRNKTEFAAVHKSLIETDRAW